MKKTTVEKTKRIFEDYEGEKAKHLERLASRMLKQDSKIQNLKKYKMDVKFLDNF